MEKLIKKVKAQKGASGKNPFSEFSMMVRKGHSECGDSAFIFSDDKKLVVGIFDGVSGDPGAEVASSDAAEATLKYLKGLDKAKEKDMKEALSKAHLAIKIGSTTGLILFLERDGSFIVASIGDSPVYSITEGKASLELPLARAVKDGDAILKFFAFRNLINAALGGPAEYLNVSIRSGKLKKGEMFILASDGLMDNLFVEVKGGYVTDSSGSADLGSLIRRKKTPAAIVKLLMETIEKRIKVGKVEKKGRVLHPKDDDIAIAVVKRL
jgi:serine/threonine protein phosphatase PrpC